MTETTSNRTCQTKQRKPTEKQKNKKNKNNIKTHNFNQQHINCPLIAPSKPSEPGPALARCLRPRRGMAGDAAAAARGTGRDGRILQRGSGPDPGGCKLWILWYKFNIRPM